jgi:3-oxoacyl-[acyl-carrier-protein] synthase-3
MKDVDMLVMHQANVRIIGAIADKLELPPEKVVINVDRFGNTSSASIPLALNDAVNQDRLKPGMLVALAAVGGGMSWGCNLMRW